MHSGSLTVSKFCVVTIEPGQSAVLVTIQAFSPDRGVSDTEMKRFLSALWGNVVCKCNELTLHIPRKQGAVRVCCRNDSKDANRRCGIPDDVVCDLLIILANLDEGKDGAVPDGLVSVAHSDGSVWPTPCIGQ
jgi:hypothetical protein